MGEFECKECGAAFSVADDVLAKYPGWAPARCLKCKRAASPAPSHPRKKKPPPANPRATESALREEDLTLAEVLDKYTDGPTDGVFTDGASHPNPGPGGWGAVYVEAGKVVQQAHGHDPDTTNNRMELTALLEGARLVPEGKATVVWTDSQLCVNTITSWAAGWKRRGWTRKGGPIKNLDLVKQAFDVFQARPELQLRWIKAHSGFRWNEYADALATAYRRQHL